jgi:hypothetical protein
LLGIDVGDDGVFTSSVDLIPSSTVSSSGVNIGIIELQSALFSSTRMGDEFGDDAGGTDGVYFRTMSVHRWKTVSEM